jgi:hypothetical protein
VNAAGLIFGRRQQLPLKAGSPSALNASLAGGHGGLTI